MLGVGIGLGVGEFIGRRPGLAPKLDLNFASTKTLTSSKGPTPSFSRASTGTYFNSSGVLTTAAINGARFDHTFNGTSWVSKGLLVEEQRTNSAQYSEDLSNAYWTKAGATISANNANAPDGNLTADKVVETAANIQHTLYNSGFSVTAGSASTVSFYAKSAGRNFIQFPLADVITGAGSQGRVNFDLSTGTIGQVVGTNLTAEIIDVGNGWYRCVVKSSSAVSSGTGYIQFNLVNSSTATPGQAYLGDGTSGVLVWGVQLENGSSFATSYIPSLSNSSTTRSADVCQITGSDFSGFWNGTEGTLAIEYDQSQYASGSNNYAVAALSSGTALMAITSSLYGGSPSTYWQVYNGTAQAEIPFSMIQNGTAFKFAAAYKANDFAATQNGAAVGTDTSGSIPSANQMSIGYFAGYGQYINGHIARLRYYNKRLPNATLQKLST